MSHDGNVMVLDAHLRHSLALVRSLGRAGVKVLAVSPRGVHPAGASRYCWRTEVWDPDAQNGGSLDRIASLIEKYDIKVMIPAALPGNEFICRHRDVLEPLVRAPFNDMEQFEILSQKNRTVELGRSLGVPCPASATVEAPDKLDRINAEFRFPVVFKSIVDQGTVRYANSSDELVKIAGEFWQDNPDLIGKGLKPIVQEYIKGTGHGYYGLGRNGEIYAYFMHRRMHEVPPSGGPSAMACSYYDEELKAMGEKFFTATGWNGPAMVETKKSEVDGQYYLIEVNPKFWGSLELGISSGVDFPLILYRRLSGLDDRYVPGQYRRGHVFRWLTMDLAHSVQDRRIFSFLGDFFDRSIHDDFHWSDPIPSMIMFGQGIKRFF